MLKSLRLQNFKGISDVSIDLEAVNIIIGPNNAGKSSVLQALQFAVSVAQSIGLEEVAWNKESISSTLSSQQLVYSPLRDVHALAKGGQLRQDEKQAIKITLTTDDLGDAEVMVRRGKNKNISVTINGIKLGKRIQNIDHPFSVFVPGLAGIPAFEEFRNPGLVRRAAARGDANSVFRNVLWLLHQSHEAWQNFCIDLKNLFPDTDINLRFNPNTDEHINAMVNVAGASLPIDSSGTGLLQAIQILTYVNVYRPSILILDEPDSHLHPDNQRKLARLLLKIAEERKIQVILSTHSRHLLDEFSSEEAKIHWLSSGGIGINENIDRIRMLLDLGALDTGDRLRNGATPYIVLTEDEDTKPIRAIISACGFEAGSYDVWSYKGCANINVALTLTNFIRDHAPGTKIILHKDRDYSTEDQCNDFISELQNNNVYVFLTDGVDVESHFISADHIATIIPIISPDEAQILIQDATNLSQEKSINKFINSITEDANRNRNAKRTGPVNYGDISLQAIKLYHSNPERYRHGKTVLRSLKSLIHQRFNFSTEIVQASPALCHTSFTNLLSMNKDNSINNKEEYSSHSITGTTVET